MEDINTLYYNSFGIAFQWKRVRLKDIKKVQLVFRNTGLFLTHTELIQFSKQVLSTFQSPNMCKDCKQNDSCKSLLLQTPSTKISLAVSYKELENIQDLVKGALVQLELENVFKANAISKKS